jgi:CRISPR-associated protein Cas2
MSRLTLEVKAGVFVGTFNARVRDKLWERITKEWNVNAIMLYQTNTEQGYGIRSHGDPDKEVIDFDGIMLLTKLRRLKEEKEETIGEDNG